MRLFLSNDLMSALATLSSCLSAWRKRNAEAWATGLSALSDRGAPVPKERESWDIRRERVLFFDAPSLLTSGMERLSIFGASPCAPAKLHLRADVDSQLNMLKISMLRWESQQNSLVFAPVAGLRPRSGYQTGRASSLTTPAGPVRPPRPADERN